MTPRACAVAAAGGATLRHAVPKLIKAVLDEASRGG